MEFHLFHAQRAPLSMFFDNGAPFKEIKVEGQQGHFLKQALLVHIRECVL